MPAAEREGTKTHFSGQRGNQELVERPGEHWPAFLSGITS